MSQSAVAYCAGLDLGPVHDSTAAALLARDVVHGRTHYSLRHLRRWPPGSPYPRIADDVRRMLLAVPLYGLRLVVDQTAVGQAVATLFNRNKGVSTRQVLISAGHAISTSEDGCTHVPKKELVSVLQMLLQTQRLKLAAGLPLAEALSHEMASFRATAKVASGGEEVSWRERAHDDLVLAVALVAWEGERNPPSAGMPIALSERGGWAWGYGW